MIVHPIVARLAGTLPVIVGMLLLVGLSDALVLAWQFWWPGRIPDDSTSGVWTALAVDYAQGHFYRPVVSEFGYGGTRYMPLYFMYMGTLIAGGLTAVAAGIIAMQSTVLATLLGIVLVLRRVGVSRGGAMALALVTYCTTVFQHYVTDTNCEYLATAFSLFAFALYLQPEGRKPKLTRLLLVALLSCLGFYSKLTTLYVPAAVLLHLLMTRRWRDAAFFAATGILLLVAFFMLFMDLSNGLILENIASAITGGTPLGYVPGFLGRFLWTVFVSNPAIGVTMLIAALACITQWRAYGATPVVLVFVMVMLATVLTFVSRGVVGNHVISLHAFSLVMIGASLADQRFRAFGAAGFGVLTIISLVALMPGIAAPRQTLELAGRETISELKAAILRHRHDERPIASNDGSVSALFGERAPILDDYNLWIAVTNDPARAADLKRRLAARQFSVLALNRGTVLEDENYVEVERVGRFRILVPRLQ